MCATDNAEKPKAIALLEQLEQCLTRKDKIMGTGSLVNVEVTVLKGNRNGTFFFF